MDPKKKTFMENLRMKTKFPNLKKPGKKAAGKQGKKLAYRRSLSVPDLRLTVEPSETDSPLLTGDSDVIFFGTSPGQSDVDSIASGSITSESSFTERSRRNAVVFANRINEPLENPTISEGASDVTTKTGSESRVHSTGEAWHAQVKSPKLNLSSSHSFPIIATTSSAATNAHVPPPKPTPSADNNISTERHNGLGNVPADAVNALPGVAAALARASSFGDQLNLSVEKQAASTEQRKPAFERVSPLALRRNVPADRWSLPADRFESPTESAGGTPLDSACGTPSEERVNTHWTTDSEDLDREQCLPSISEIFSMEEPQLEGAQLEDVSEETLEISSGHSDLFDEAIRDPLDNSVLTAGSEVITAVPFQRYLLTINLKEGRNMVIKNKRSEDPLKSSPASYYSLTSTSDPYVKFKLEGKQFYKSKVVYKNLNPRWNESFSHPLRDREHAIEARVYDKNRTSDEFMGSSTINLNNLELYKTEEMELRLEDPKSKEDDIGVIIVDVCLMFRDATIKRSPRWPQKKNKGGQQPNQGQTAAAAQSQAHAQKNQLKNHLWSGVFSVTLVEGQDLPQHGQGDVYARFRLGDQKYKSKNLCIQANPQWREQFDFNQFEDNQEPLQVEVYAKRGRKCEESWGMFEVDLSRVPVNESQFYTRVLDPGKGRLVFLVTLAACCGVSISDIHAAPLEQPDERDTLLQKFSLPNSLRHVKEVGFLQVKVIKATDLLAADLNGKSDPFCVIELGNSRLQTQTVYKTLNPEWNKAFTFPIKDIHDVIELSVFDENTDKAPNFLGKVAIPLLTVENGQQICQFLKKENLGRPSKGTITLVLDVIYNKVRAGVKTFQPKETKFTEENQKFSKKALAQNIYRVRKISTAVLYTLQYIKSCFQWESTQRSLIAFLIFLVTVWNWELFMLPLFLLLLIGWNFFHLTSGRANSSQDLLNMSMTDDDEEEDEKEPGKKGLMEKIHMVQEVVITVQNILEEIASIGERIKNTFNWSVPFLSCLACLVLFVATAALYYVPLRYIVLIWGVNKFTKKLRNRHAIDNNEILDFLKRVPSDVQKVQYSALRAPGIHSPPRRRK